MRNPYEGLSEEAVDLAVKRMSKTLTATPKHRKTRDYIRTLTGERETPQQLRARAREAVRRASLYTFAREVAKSVIAKAAAGDCPAEIVRVRKDRVAPFARARGRHLTKYCRKASRHRWNIRGGARDARDMDETMRHRVVLVEAQGGICAICGHPMPAENFKASLDHVIPRSMGGKDGLGNYVACHGECNGDKTNDVPTGCEMVWLLMVNAKLGVLPVVY